MTDRTPLEIALLNRSACLELAVASMLSRHGADMADWPETADVQREFSEFIEAREAMVSAFPELADPPTVEETELQKGARALSLDQVAFLQDCATQSSISTQNGTPDAGMAIGLSNLGCLLLAATGDDYAIWKVTESGRSVLSVLGKGT